MKYNEKICVHPTIASRPGMSRGMRLAERAAVAYAALFVVALSWRAYRGYEVFPVGEPGRSLLLGTLSAAGTVGAALLCYRFVPVFRSLADELAPGLIDGVKLRGLIATALFSGVGEEAFFRGALQPEVGIVWASLIFGLMHLGPGWRFLPWALWASLAGFVFGWLYLATGGLLAPMVAHALHNGVMLSLWKLERTRWNR